MPIPSRTIRLVVKGALLPNELLLTPLLSGIGHGSGSETILSLSLIIDQTKKPVRYNGVFNMVKIGKTHRSPSLRMQSRSSPTPLSITCTNAWDASTRMLIQLGSDSMEFISSSSTHWASVVIVMLHFARTGKKSAKGADLVLGRCCLSTCFHYKMSD